jgi:lia operon protein LiaH
MNIIQRFITEVEVTLHDLFDKKEKNNPLARLNLYVRQVEKETMKVKELIKRQNDLLEKLRSDIPVVETQLENRKDQLELAQEANDEQLLDFAKQEVASLEMRLQVLQETEQETAAQYMELELKFEQMKHQLEYMKVRQLQLMSKENSAHANAYMDEVTNKQSGKYGTNVEEAMAYIKNMAIQNETTDATSLEKRLIALQSK